MGTQCRNFWADWWIDTALRSGLAFHDARFSGSDPASGWRGRQNEPYVYYAQ